MCIRDSSITTDPPVESSSCSVSLESAALAVCDVILLINIMLPIVREKILKQPVFFMSALLFCGCCCGQDYTVQVCNVASISFFYCRRSRKNQALARCFILVPDLHEALRCSSISSLTESKHNPQPNPTPPEHFIWISSANSKLICVLSLIHIWRCRRAI